MWQAVVRLDRGSPLAFAELMEREAAGISVFEAENGGWTITSLHRGRPDAGMIRAGLAVAAAAAGIDEPALELAPLPATDWLEAAYAGFPARRVGRFYIHGSHVTAPPPPGARPLHIDAATAFGSGEHATTEGCLLAIDRLGRRRAGLGRALDMGTGSAILAIAIARTWPTAKVEAIDIDPESARVAAANARLNRVAGRVRARQGNGFDAASARTGAAFDLIVANILARPLIRMAPALAGRLAPGGTVVLSGLLKRQEASVLSAYRRAGLCLARRFPISEWQTLVLKR
jgi:ribosomal protein L11 methyltransferase